MLLKIDSGIAPGHDSATGTPVRSHHLSGLWEGTAVKGELLHHNQQLNYTPEEKTCQSSEREIERAEGLQLPDLGTSDFYAFLIDREPAEEAEYFFAGLEV